MAAHRLIVAATTLMLVAAQTRMPVEIASAAVSASAFATWGADLDAQTGAGRLTFLVLLRGSTGWVFHAGGVQQGGESRSRGGPGSDAGVTDVIHHWLSVGPMYLEFTLNRPTRQIMIGKDTVSLAPNPRRVPGVGDTNTILMDGADSPQGPHIVKTMWVDPQMPSPSDVGAVVKRTAELRAFVGCDEKFDDPQQQTMNDYLCK
jgi:hypothetical protein